MSQEKQEDVRDTAVKLGAIYLLSPTDYAYLKGWIHCLLQKEDNDRKFSNDSGLRESANCGKGKGIIN